MARSLRRHLRRCRLGELGRGRCGQGHDRRASVRQAPGGRHTDRRMRIDQLRARLPDLADSGGGFGLAHRLAAEPCGHVATGSVRQAHGTRGCEVFEGRRRGRRIPSQGLEHQTLEIRGDLDIHGRALGGHGRAPGIFAVPQGPGEDVVAVGGDDDLLHRKAHLRGHVTGEGIAEIARGHHEADRPVRRAEGRGGSEVVDALRRNPRPVDGIHAGQAHLVPEAVIAEQPLHDGLAIVEVPGHRQAGDVGIRRRGHEPALDIADPPIGEQDDQFHVTRAAKGFDGRTAGVAGRGGDDGEGFPAQGQDPVIKPRQQLHRHVLEGERRATGQVQHPAVGVQFHKRSRGRVVEGGVGTPAQRFAGLNRQGVAGKGLQHAGRDGRIGQRGKARDLVRREPGPLGGHIEATIRCETGQQHILEGDGRGAAAGGDIAHVSSQVRGGRAGPAQVRADGQRKGSTTAGAPEEGDIDSHQRRGEPEPRHGIAHMIIRYRNGDR